MTGSPIGLSTNAFFWQSSTRADHPLTLPGMIAKTAELGASVFQICDHPALAEYSNRKLRELRETAAECNIKLELGTRGVQGAHLRQWLDIAARLDVTLLRSMFNTADHKPTPREAAIHLRRVVPAYEKRGVTIALETYEQVPTAVLVDTVRAIDSDYLGICIDPANCIAALETPTATIQLAAPYAKNLHVKDFQFTRQEGWVGFRLIGAPLGSGQLDYEFLIKATKPADRRISRIIEHWVPWQGSIGATIALEKRWTVNNIEFLRKAA
jgi:3-oxoisoapionate decarboxylase